MVQGVIIILLSYKKIMGYFCSKEEFTLNVGGRKYLVFRETISKFPTTRLGKISLMRNVDEMREHCDGIITDRGLQKLVDYKLIN